jgi:cation diffusion facilitator CzcD-associated flavoprotein CzcO
MLQRSPTYFRTGRNAVELADTLRELQVDEGWIHEIVRRRLLVDQFVFTSRAFSEPEKVREELLDGVRAALGPGSEDIVEKHFTPKYLPWRQRVAFVPDGDLFKALKSGQASIVTDEIDRFTENGIRLKSGHELTADLVVTATGFEISALGDIPFEIDGKKLDFGQTITYRGMMFTDVPNLAWVMGYFRASWTLRADLVAEFVCRLLRHMRERAASKVEVALREEDQGMRILPWVDDDNFNPGYIVRGVHLWPKRGDRPDWRPGDHYWTEKDEIRSIDLDGSAFVYNGHRTSTAEPKRTGGARAG